MVQSNSDVQLAKRIISFYQAKIMHTEKPILLLFALDEIYAEGVYATLSKNVFVGIISRNRIKAYWESISHTFLVPVIVAGFNKTERVTLKKIKDDQDATQKYLNLPESDMIRAAALGNRPSDDCLSNVSPIGRFGRLLTDDIRAFTIPASFYKRSILPVYTLVELSSGVRMFVAAGYDYAHKAVQRKDHADEGWLYSLSPSLQDIYNYYTEPELIEINKRNFISGYTLSDFRVIESANDVRKRLKDSSEDFIEFVA